MMPRADLTVRVGGRATPVVRESDAAYLFLVEAYIIRDDGSERPIGLAVVHSEDLDDGD